MSALLKYHWQVKGPTPPALTENQTSCPTFVATFCGWVVITGGVMTVNVAFVLVTFPPRLVTFTV